jgi:hypothetical protein
MPTCTQCSSAIASLAFQNIQKLRSERENISYPVELFHHIKAKSCWICAKFLSWLEMEHQDSFETCHIRPIPMEFSIDSFLIIHDTKAGTFTFDLDMNITIKGLSRSTDSCEFNLYLMPVQGAILYYTDG